MKDRAALGLVENAEANGRCVFYLIPPWDVLEADFVAQSIIFLPAIFLWSRSLKPGGTVVEGTAGNTGIGLAHVCRAKGYKCVIYMPNTQVRYSFPTVFHVTLESVGDSVLNALSSQSQEKIDLLRMLGADVRPVPAVAFENPLNYNHQAREYAESIPNAIWTDQFDNTANAEAHYRTTGPEIWTQTNGDVDGFICATGTGGTLAGVGRYLTEKSQGRTQIWIADPPGSVLHSYITSGGKLKERTGSSITEGATLPLSKILVTKVGEGCRYRSGTYHEQLGYIRGEGFWLFEHRGREVYRYDL